MFKLPDLGYRFDALEPYIDAQTMEIHHGKHHAAYIAKLNEALRKYPDLHKKTIEDLLKSIGNLPEGVKTAVRNNGGGHHNHSLFWEIIQPGGNNPTPAVTIKLEAAFGSFENFKEQFFYI